jgi:RNA polymerase sigma-70 factor (ECF subfamily)
MIAVIGNGLEPMSKRDNKAFNADGLSGNRLYEQMLSILARFFAARGVRGDDVDDLVQESLLTFFLKQSHIAVNNPRAYLFGIAKRLLLAFRRKAAIREGVENKLKREEKRLQDAIGDSRLGSEGEDTAWLKQIVAQLPNHLQKVIHLRYFKGCSRRETARRLRLGGATVRSFECRALMRLKKLVEKARKITRPGPL